MAAYCGLLVQAQNLPYPEPEDTSLAATAIRANYFALVSQAADVAEEVGRMGVSVFLSLAVEVERNPDQVSPDALTRLQETAPAAQTQINLDCGPVAP